MHVQNIRLKLLKYVRVQHIVGHFPDYVYFVCAEICPTGKVSCGADATLPCIPEAWLCDGRDDCGDNGDEEACGQLTAAATTISLTITIATTTTRTSAGFRTLQHLQLQGAQTLKGPQSI